MDFNSIKLEIGERPEDLYQILISFTEDNLLSSEGSIRHHGAVPTEDEELTPIVENIIVLTWLRLIYADLPGLVKQCYETDLRSQTLASLKPEISLALDSLLNELEYSCDLKVGYYVMRINSKASLTNLRNIYLVAQNLVLFVSCLVRVITIIFLAHVSILKYLKSRQTVCIGD